MRAIVAAIEWSGSDFDLVGFWRRISLISPGIGVSGVWEVSTGAGGTVGCAGGESRRACSSAVGVLARAGVLVAGDCRLVDQRALASEVDRARQPSTDLDLVASAYSKWADEFPVHLTGDFAVIVYDGSRDQVLLAVGASQARQLYYRPFVGGVLVTSHPALLQAITPLRQSDVDATVVHDYLLGHYRDSRRTFFSDVTRVPPGQQVVLRNGSTISRDYFLPPVPREDRRTIADCHDEFRHVFEACLADAVDPGAHHAVHLSGGLDSSSIAATLPRVATGKATFELLTAVFPTIRMCNEMSTVTAVARLLPFPVRLWDAERSPDFAREVALSAWPLGLVPSATANRDDLHMAAGAGAVAVLTGDGGDSLTLETAVFRDLSRRRLWRLLWDELAAVELRGFERRYVIHQVVRDLLRRAVGRGLPGKRRVPSWFGPALRGLKEEVIVSGSSPAESLPDLVQQQVWNSMTNSTVMWVTEAMNLRASQVGVDLRSPYRDPRLTRFVAAISYDLRLCTGKLRRLQREGLADRLPPKVRQRIKVDFSPAVKALVRTEWRLAEPLINAREWCSEPYVPKAAFDALVEGALGDGKADFRDWARVRRMWTLELWLRRYVL